MNGKIIIIHNSEIVRNGLSATIRNYFNVEIIQMGDCDRDHLDLGNVSMVFCSPEKRECLDRIRERMTDTRSVSSVAIVDHIIPGKKPFPFDSIIDINTTSAQIHELCKKGIGSTEKTSGDHEGESLTTREKEVLKLVALGHSSKAIADKLYISVHTVISHRKNITEKTGIKSVSGLTIYAILNKMIDTDNINLETLI